MNNLEKEIVIVGDFDLYKTILNNYHQANVEKAFDFYDIYNNNIEEMQSEKYELKEKFSNIKQEIYSYRPSAQFILTSLAVYFGGIWRTISDSDLINRSIVTLLIGSLNGLPHLTLSALRLIYTYEKINNIDKRLLKEQEKQLSLFNKLPEESKNIIYEWIEKFQLLHNILYDISPFEKKRNSALDFQGVPHNTELEEFIAIFGNIPEELQDIYEKISILIAKRDRTIQALDSLNSPLEAIIKEERERSVIAIAEAASYCIKAEKDPINGTLQPLQVQDQAIKKGEKKEREDAGVVVAKSYCSSKNILKKQNVKQHSIFPNNRLIFNQLKKYCTGISLH